jgi:hypothetical protein
MKKNEFGQRPSSISNLKKANLVVDKLTAEVMIFIFPPLLLFLFVIFSFQNLSKDFKIDALEKQLEYSSRESAREIARLRTKLFELEIGLAMTANSDGTNSAANLFDDQMLQEIDFPQLPEFMRKEQDDQKQEEEQAEQEKQVEAMLNNNNNENRKLDEIEDNFSRSRNTILDTMKDTDTLNNNDYQRDSGNSGGGAGVPRRKTVIHTGSYNQNKNQNSKSATTLAPASFIHPEENPTPLLPNMEFLRQESGIDIDRIPTPKELMRLENESITKHSSRKSLAADKSEQELLEEIMSDIQKSPSKVSLAASSGKVVPSEKELMNEILNDINN